MRSEKDDQEQLEYLREWKKKRSGRVKEESAREFARKVGNYGRKNF